MLKSPPLVATLSDSMRMSPCSWGDIFTWPLRGDRIIGLRHRHASLFRPNARQRTIVRRGEYSGGRCGIRGAVPMRTVFLIVCAFPFVLMGCSREDATNSHPTKSRSLPVVLTVAETYTYPLKISGNGRYLVDHNNMAFRIQGDSAQSLIANLTLAEAEMYFADRQAKGFNSININLFEHKFAVGHPANRRGDIPFTTPGDFSTPNESYFAFVDSILDLAASKGMRVSLAVMYLGNGGGDEGWWTTLTGSANPPEVCYKFGLYVGNRLKKHKNILWVIGGDYLPPAGSEGEMRLHKFMEGVKVTE